MIPEFAQAWAERQDHLKEWFMSHVTPTEHRSLVKIVFDEVINPSSECHSYNADKIKTFTDGIYNGEELYVIPCDSGNFEDYVITTDYFGSCSGCDSLLAINSAGFEADEDDARKLCLLALGILQRCRKLETLVVHED